MKNERLKIVMLGLSITSSWGNGHATTYRGLVKGLHTLGHEVLFLERETPWYSANRDMPSPGYCRAACYGSLEELKDRFAEEVRDAGLVIIGSYVPGGSDIARWVFSGAKGVKAFYDIDTPVTMARMKRGETDYLSPELISRYDLYLSFTGGPMLAGIKKLYGAKDVKPLYCSADPEIYYPEPLRRSWQMGYMGTYSEDRQPALERLLIEPARRLEDRPFIVAGPQYPGSIKWPQNVKRTTHLSPGLHRGFYNGQAFTLNITRREMISAGYSPSVRLFEAAACATPIISDYWRGLEEFFTPGREILIASSPEEVTMYLSGMPEEERLAMGIRGRIRALSGHTGLHRARELQGHVFSVIEKRAA